MEISFLRCIYKHGDKLLQDALCVGVMKEMNNIFSEENIDAEVVLYDVRIRLRKLCSMFFDLGSSS